MTGNATSRRLQVAAVVAAAVLFAVLFVVIGAGSPDDSPASSTLAEPPRTSSTTVTSPPAVTSSSSTQPEPVTADIRHVGGSFVAFSDAPIRRAFGASVVWTGRELIVWGGQINPGGDTTAGAAFDPATRVWRALSPSPQGPRFAHTAVWTGKRIILWGGVAQRVDAQGHVFGEGLVDGASYDPEPDSWDAVPPAPIGPQDFPVALWTGVEMIILGDGPGEAGTLPAAAYHPATESWRLLPELHVGSDGLGHGPLAAVWTGEAVVAAGAGIGANRVAIYRPAVDEWETINVPIGPRFGHTVTWTGTEVLVWGGSEPTSELPVGFAFNVDTSQWRPLAPPPVTEREGHGAAWTGTEVLMWGGSIVRPLTNASERVSFGVLYDPLSDKWSVIDAPGTPTDAFGPDPFEVVWLGDTALLWNQAPDESGILTLDP